jgi:hypothetical protein
MRPVVGDPTGGDDRSAQVEPYFSSEAAGRGPGYVEFRIGDYQHELGIIDRRFAPPGLAAGPGGALVYWHVDDVAATWTGWSR